MPGKSQIHCPKCGRENPSHAQTCILCGCDLTSPLDLTKPKTSKIAVVSLVLAVLSIFAFLVTALPAIVLGCVALTKIRRSKGRLKGEHLAIAAIAVPIIAFPVALFVLHSLWKLDAPPIPNDYTIADLRSAPEDCADSYELLLSLSEEDQYRKDAPAIGLSAQDVNTIGKISDVIKEGDYSKITESLKANEDNIKQAWENGQKGRDIISELNTFPEIADLTEPSLDAEIKFLSNLRLLAYLYQSYACLQTEQGNAQSAVNELIIFDSIFRKLSINSRSILTKLVCFAALDKSIRTANIITNNPKTTQEALEILSEHFQPLADEQISLRNSIISGYLMFKNTLYEDPNVHKFGKAPMLKWNSTFRLYKNFCEHCIARDVIESSQEFEKADLSVWPSIYPIHTPVSIDSEDSLPWFYTAYNPIGSLLIQILTPATNRILELKTNLKVQDDLFQIVLSKRHGREVSLKARAYSDEYIVDVEGRKIFSPGPDGQIDTKDDIKLPINPQVLGWEN